MAYKHLQRYVALCLLICFAALSAFAQDYKSLIGKWDMTSETEGDSVRWTLSLKEIDGKLSATLVAGENEVPAKDFTYTDGVLKFKVPYEGDFYDIELKATADKLTGTWSGGGNSGRTTGTKT
jgi:hypothetical protein